MSNRLMVAGTISDRLSTSSVLKLVSHSPEQTREIGRLVGQTARPGEVFPLTGTLGAGKTCLTQGIAWGLGVEGYARSPTFVLITRYQGRLTLHHVDLFRVQDSLEALDLGLEEYLGGQDVCVVEWAERSPEIFPQGSIWITLEYGAGDTERLITVHDKDGKHADLIKALKHGFDGCEDG